MQSISLSDPNYVVESDDVSYSSSTILSYYSHQLARVNQNKITKITQQMIFKTERTVPRIGVMLIGWGGNNGSTVTASVLANREQIKWHTKEGLKTSNYFGSLTQSSTIHIGDDEYGRAVYLPFKNILPMVNPNDLLISGWDINSANLGDAMRRSQVLDYDFQRQLYDKLTEFKPLPSIYYPEFIASNQSERANNVLQGTKQENLETIRNDIRHFKQSNNLDKVILLWTANTERFCDIVPGINDTAENLLASIQRSESEISPSTIFAIASILEGCSYINGSPQNTFVPGVVELAESHGVFIGGDDFKSGQTKMKSVLVDFLVSAGLKPRSIVSYNHLGNNDGMNLSAPAQFRSKEISKSNVVDDMVQSNSLLYAEGEHPDHVVVIKYVPYVGDSKRAMDEYVSEIFMGGTNTIVMHNTCEDSLLAAPLILDLIILTELCERISVCTNLPKDHSTTNFIDLVPDLHFERFHSVLSILSYLLKAPMVPPGAPVVNALAAQRQCIINIFRACVGLPPDDFMSLQHKIPALMAQNHTLH